MPIQVLTEEVVDGLGLPLAGRIDVAIEIPDGLEISADHDQLYRVLTNLCRNAKQAIETVDCHDPGLIRVCGQRQGDRVVITLSDTGPGVPKKAREHLFEAFQSTARDGGTGLGLVISAELARAHGGTVELCESDQGAHFRLTIPDGGGPTDVFADRLRSTPRPP